jgi:Mlc titration factor MtfA (ptsG expression regulator)
MGTVVLAWDEVAEGALEPGDAYNPVYHEFAHLLDFQHALTPNDTAWADPLTEAYWDREPTVADPAEWRRVLEESYERRCEAREGGAEDVLREYAATNRKEFFAVATEAFFERPHDLRAAYPALYAQLKSLYDQDPAGPYGTLR